MNRYTDTSFDVPNLISFYQTVFFLSHF